MRIASAGIGSISSTSGQRPLDRLKKAFDDLGTALASGNLSDAKQAFAQLKQNSPPNAGQGGNPVSNKLDAIGKALDSGDLKAAQDAYADVKKTIAERQLAGRPSGGGKGPGGPRQGGGGHAASGSGSTSSSSQVYDPADTNQDGTVSAAEQISYQLKHAASSSNSTAGSAMSTTNSATTLTSIDTYT